jgi:hypothetical protein
LLPLQQGSDSRWLHPQFYDWPGEGSEAFAAMLPVLNWTAARASDVVVQVLTEWKRVLAQHSDLPTPPPTLYCNTRHLQICNSPDDPAKLRMRPPKKSTPQCFFIRVCSRTCSTSLVRCRWRRITLRTAGRASRARGTQQSWRPIWIWPLWIRGRVLLRLRRWGVFGAPSLRLCLGLLLTSDTAISCALHPQRVRRPIPLLGGQQRLLPYAAREGHSATYGDVTRHIACLRRRLSRVELVDPFLRMVDLALR